MHKVMSQAQIDANRRNAQKSTGPKSPQGKARSARNNTRHGFFTDDLVLACGPFAEDPADLAQLRAVFHDEYQPSSQYERDLVDTMALCSWRTRRAYRFEAHSLARDAEPGAADHPDSTFFGSNAVYSLVGYENRHERQFNRALESLQASKADGFSEICRRLDALVRQRSSQGNEEVHNKK